MWRSVEVGGGAPNPPVPPHRSLGVTTEEFHRLVERVEVYARERPQAYRLRLALLAVLGYAYVWLVLAGVVAVLALLVWLAVIARTGAIWAIGKFGIALAVLAFAILRSLWVRFDAPGGVRLQRRTAPPLRALLKDLTRRLKTPRFHAVLVTSDFNAAINQRPLLGFFGWYRNTLLLGLPLMEALPLPEFRAVLAHELGHLSREHGRLSAWIYRMRMTWTQLTARLEAQHHWGFGLFDWFLKRWAPYFNAYSFVLARRHEYEADRLAADLAGGEHLARALVHTALRDAYLDRHYWPILSAELQTTALPPADAMARLTRALREPLPQDAGRQWLAEALARKTGLEDTHPSLSERLTALEVAPPPDGGADLQPEPSAAEALIGAALPQLRVAVERVWHTRMQPGWAARHQALAAARSELVELNRRATERALRIGEVWRRAELVMELDGDEKAEPLLRELLDHEPDHVAANFALGRILLARGEAAGREALERAVQRDPTARAAAYHLIKTYYEREGRKEEARAYQQRAWEEGERMASAEEERKAVTPADAFLPHALDPAALAAVQAALARMPDVKVAYLGRKAVTHLPELHLHVLAVELRNPWWRLRRSGWSRGVLRRLVAEVPVPGQWFAVSLAGKNARIGKKLKRLPGARL